ncbi:MAG TPA: polysaccharide deacetylase family protein [Solirubrobacterales bacterium]|nr:polysaccharide deacetylase family protein [Solirubrobacterales bacterium]
MTDPFGDEHGYLTELPEDLRLRRAATARRRRWRRRLAVGAFLLAVGAVVALAVTSLGGGGGSKQGAEANRSAGGASAAGQTTTSFPADWRPSTAPVPILEYHAIQPPVAGSAYPELFVTQADFQHQMQWLKDNGYEAVTLNQVEDSWYEHGELPPKPVVVSLDDGYLSQYVAAFPELQHLGWKGVLNLKASGSDLPDADAKKMIAAGWELASHTITHPDLTTLDAASLQRELVGSRQILRKRFGVPVDNFCYPSGRYDDTVIAAVQKAGYRGAESEVFGLASAAHPYILNRIEVENSDGLSGFVQKLKAAQTGSATFAPSPGG